MSLIINQGKQAETTTNTFPVIVEKNVPLKIESIALNQFKSNALNIKFLIVGGDHKNQYIFDSVEYDPNSQFSYRYRALRSCAGVPYSQSEPAQIDIEALLKNKVVYADLSARVGKDKDGNPKDYQNVDYKKMPVKQQTNPAKEQVKNAVYIEEEVSDDDLPFKSAPVSVAQEQKAAKPTVDFSEDDWD